jgi:hypothetical protein
MLIFHTDTEVLGAFKTIIYNGSHYPYPSKHQNITDRVLHLPISTTTVDFTNFLTT